MRPTYSAVITTHNRAELLRLAINSVLAQTLSPEQIIIVDDASSDSTLEVLQRLIRDVPNLVVKRNDIQMGGQYSRNLGIAHVNTTYVALLDDDDTWEPTKAERQLSLLERDPSIGCVICRDDYTFLTPTVMNFLFHFQIDFNHLLTQRSIAGTSTYFCRKMHLRANTPFDEKLRKMQDYEFLIGVSLKSKILFYNKKLVNYGTTEENRVSQQVRFNLPSLLYIKNKYKRLFSRRQRVIISATILRAFPVNSRTIRQRVCSYARISRLYISIFAFNRLLRFFWSIAVSCIKTKVGK